MWPKEDEESYLYRVVTDAARKTLSSTTTSSVFTIQQEVSQLEARLRLADDKLNKLRTAHDNQKLEIKSLNMTIEKQFNANLALNLKVASLEAQWQMLDEMTGEGASEAW